MCTFGPNKKFCLYITDIGRVIYKSNLILYKRFSNSVIPVRKILIDKDDISICNHMYLSKGIFKPSCWALFNKLYYQ